MSTPFDNAYHGNNSRPLRRDINGHFTLDEQGNPHLEPVTGEATTLSTEGSIDRCQYTGFHHCGHSAQIPMGGRCGEPGCRNVSCQNCFARCQRCQKPLCLEHLRKLQIEAETLVLCGRCEGEVRRRRRLRAIVRGFLSPFVEFEDRRTS